MPTTGLTERRAAGVGGPALRQTALALTLATGLVVVLLGALIGLPDREPLVLLGGLVVIGLAAWMALTRRYELTLAVLMLYLGLVDGYLKLKTDSDAVTLGRDVLLYAIAAGAIGRLVTSRRAIALPPLTGWVVAWLAVVAVQLFNPDNGTLSHTVQSVRPHVEFVPLFFLAYVVMRTKRRLVWFFGLLLAIAAVNGLVGLVQFNLSPDQLSSWGPGYAERIEGTGDVSARAFVDDGGTERTRPFGLGSDIGFAGIIGLIAVPAALALLSLGRRPGLRVLTVPLAIGVVLAVVTSQARIAVLGAVVALVAYIALSASSRGLSRALVGVAVAGAVGFAAISTLSSGSETGSFDRYNTIAPGSALSTTIDYRKDTLSRIPEYAVDYPFGAGIGSKGPAGSIPGAGPGAVLDSESEPTYLLIELGIPGLVVLLGLFLHLFALALGRIRQLGDPELRILLAALSAPLFAIFVSGIVGINSATTPSAPYLWFAAGTLSYWLCRPGWRSGGEAARRSPPSGDARPEATAIAVDDRRDQPSSRRAPASTGWDASAPRRAPAPPVRTVALLYNDRGGRGPDGIRDYSGLLGRQLELDPATDAVVITRARRGSPRAAARRAGRDGALVLQYNPFAYARWGFAPWLALEMAALRRRAGRPRLGLMVHEPYVALVGVKGSAMGLWQRLQLGLLWWSADVVFVSIPGWATRATRWAPRRPVVHLPVGSNMPDMRGSRDDSRARLGAGHDTLVIAAIGRDHPSWRGELLIAAVREAAATIDGRPTVVLLGATAPALPELEAVADVHRFGYLDEHELASTLAAADLFVAPLIDGVSSRRGTVMAALQHGVPVLGTTGHLTDPLFHVERDALRLVPVDDVDGLAAAARSLATDRSARQAIGAAGRALYLREFDWPVIARRMRAALFESAP